MMDKRLSKPKEVQQTGSGKVYRCSNHKIQDEFQRSFYRSGRDFGRTSGCMSPLVEKSRSFENNLTSYTNIKQIKNTIDM